VFAVCGLGSARGQDSPAPLAVVWNAGATPSAQTAAAAPQQLAITFQPAAGAASAPAARVVVRGPGPIRRGLARLGQRLEAMGHSKIVIRGDFAAAPMSAAPLAAASPQVAGVNAVAPAPPPPVPRK